MKVLFFKPIPRPALWGGTMVKDYFGYHDFGDDIGQAWAFSAQPQASNICTSPPFEGMTLEQLWVMHQVNISSHCTHHVNQLTTLC